jgi:hypothetical protein
VYRIGYGNSGGTNTSSSGNLTLVRHGSIDGVVNPDAMMMDADAKNLYVVDGSVNAIKVIRTIVLCCGPVDPARAIADMITTIQNLINSGTIKQAKGKDLIFRLNEVLRNLAEGKTKTATNNLNTFINMINALVNSHQMTKDQAKPIIDAANSLITQLKGTKSATFGYDGSAVESVTESGIGVVYPNPSNKSFTINYEISELDDYSGKASMKIIDMNGNVISTLLDRSIQTGRYSLIWNGTYDNGSPAPGGTYFVHFRSGKTEKVKMIILIR